MVGKILFLIWCFVIMVQSQINGEFWWLNDKVAKYNRALIRPPTIEHLSEFDTDDNTNIVFREDFNYNYKDKTTNREITTTESSVRYSNDLDLNLVWPVQDKANNGKGIVDPGYVQTESTSTATVNNSKPSLDKTKALPILFPDSDITLQKDKFETKKSKTTVQIVEYITKPNSLMDSPVTNYNSEDEKNNDNNRNNNIEDRPHFGNVNVASINSFGTNNKINTSITTKKTAPSLDNNNFQSLVFSYPINSTDTKTDNSKIMNERPKFNSVDVTNIIDSTNNFKTNQINIPAVAHTQHVNTSNQINILQLNNFTTNNEIYNENKNINDKTNFGNVKGVNIPNYNLTWSNDRKVSEPSNLESKNEIVFFDEPVKQVTEITITNIQPNKNQNGNRFTFPRRDQIIWNNTPVPNRGSENIWNPTNSMNTEFGNRPKFHNVIINTQNNQSVSIDNQKATSPSTSSFQTTRPISKQDNSNIFSNKHENDFIFTYPQKNNLVWPESITSTTKTNVILHTTNSDLDIPKNEFTQSLNSGNDQVSHTKNGEKETESQNICAYMKKVECELRKGFVYTVELQIMLAKKAHDPNLICCILPSINNNARDNYSKVTIVDNPKSAKRQKRSTSDNENKEQKQRTVLLHRISKQSQHTRVPTTHPKITGPDDEYVDPYWNIKNTNFQEKKPVNTRTTYYSNEDYIQDYADELPRPGLVGIYSDTKGTKRNPGWTYTNRKQSTTYGVDVVYDSVESDETFGYSTVDPRKVVSSKPKRGGPQKSSTISDEKAIDPETLIINFASNPDFHVFQGFKLLNLVKNQSKGTRPPLTDNKDKTESKQSEEELNDSLENYYYDINEDSQLYPNCGRSIKMSKRDRKDRQIGEADSGSHPWLGLVVETKRRYNILCYATIIHPRASVTAAECVFGTSSGEITIITGLWNLNERTRSRSRVVSILVHPKYEQGNLANDLAILYWQQPLRLGVNVQPACFASHDVKEGCMFFGWGGFGQAIRPRSRWQKANIEECKTGVQRIIDNTNLFCTSVQARNSVVGMGSPLMCNIDGRQSMVGLVVAHEDDFVLLSAQEWAKKAVKTLFRI